MFALDPDSSSRSLRALHPRQARLVVIAALLSLVGLLVVLCDPRGVRQLRRIGLDLDRQRLVNAALREQNLSLERTVKALSGGDKSAAAERAVREQLGLVKDDEVVFKFE